MSRADSNITKAALIAEISRTYLLTMLRRHGLYEAPPAWRKDENGG